MTNYPVLTDQLLAEYKASGKKVLTLILKNEYFKEILNGTKKQEFREIKPTTEKKYIQFAEDGFPVEDENGNCMPLHYDAILFHVGYNADRDSMLIEVKGAQTEVFCEEDGEPIFYFYSYERKCAVDKEVKTYDPETGAAYDVNGNLIEDATQYFVEQIIFDLGEIIAAKVK